MNDNGARERIPSRRMLQYGMNHDQKAGRLVRGTCIEVIEPTVL